MKKELTDIQAYLIEVLKQQKKALKAVIDNEERYEVTGTIEAMQGKKKVEGIYFASVVPKPKDIRFYFFPLYTHREELLDTLSDELKKSLKGKTCFHIKAISDEMEKEIKEMVKTGVKLYQKDGLLAK